LNPDSWKGGLIINQNQTQRAYLVLADGTVFPGDAMGAPGEAVGEVVFNTCASSYQSVLSDPTYYGQLVAQTFPLVGNRGIVPEEVLPLGETAPVRANGYIVREWCDTPPGLGNRLTLDAYLKRYGIVGISGIDTRRLTRILRDKGYFKGVITPALGDFEDLLARISAYSISGAVAAVSLAEPVHIFCESAEYYIVVPDFGFPRRMLPALLRRHCAVAVVPAETSAREILERKPDGVLLPDGPADPDDNPRILENIRGLLQSKIPLLGIGVGHQMMALAAGGIVGEMARGHRGSNQPVRLLGTKRVMVTLQNHAYDVAAGSLPEAVASVTMANVNDGSVEGLEYHSFPGFSVQFTPQDSGLYSDTAWVYDQFLSRIHDGGLRQ